MNTSAIGNSFLHTVSLLTGTKRFTPRASAGDAVRSADRVIDAQKVNPTQKTALASPIERLKLPGSEDYPILPSLSDQISAQRKDSVEISSEANAAFLQSTTTVESPTTSAPNTDTTSIAQDGPLHLDEAEKEQVRELRERDREVRAHENAHLAAGAGVTRGGPSYTFQVGPDGKRYAVGGEVPIQVTSGSDDPNERIIHAQKVRAAALAPAEPSGADLQVAQQASQEIARAQADLRKQATQPAEESEATGALDPKELAEQAGNVQASAGIEASSSGNALSNIYTRNQSVENRPQALSQDLGTLLNVIA